MTGPKVPAPNQLLAATGSYVDRGEAEPGAGQRVTDEQLTAWDAGAPIHLYNWHTIARALIRDLRESHAREADLDQQMWDAIAERDEQMHLVDGLQQRIDKALIECAKREPQNGAQRLAHLASHSATVVPTAVIRAALTGKTQGGTDD